MLAVFTVFKNQRFAAKFTGKHLCWSLNCNEIEGWEISQNLQESTCSGALFLLKLQATLREKCPNTEVFLVRIFPYSDWIRENTDQNKLSISHSAIGTISTPNRAAFTKNLTFLHHLPSALLLTTGNSSNCLHFVNVISNIGSCGDGLRKKNQSRTRQEFFLSVFKVYGFYMVLDLVLG